MNYQNKYTQFFKKIFLFSFYVYRYFACMHVWVACVCSRRGYCQLSWECWDLKLGLLGKQRMLLNAQASLHPNYILKLYPKILLTELATQFCVLLFAQFTFILFSWGWKLSASYACGSQRTTHRSWFSPSTLRAPRVKLRSSGSTACSLPVAEPSPHPLVL